MSIFICDVCHKEFKSKQALGGHKSAAHKKGPRYSVKRTVKRCTDSSVLTRVYNCKFCGRETTNPGANKRHENRCKMNTKPTPTKRKSQKWVEAMKNKKGGNQYTKARSLGLPDPVVKDKTRKKLADVRAGRKHSLKTKEKISKKRSEYLEEVGGGGFTNIKYYREKNIFGVEFVLRGTWELEVARQLNKHHVLWIRKVYLQYVDEYTRTYTPDFYLPEHDIYVEVKGYFSEKDRRKMRLVESYNDIDLIILCGKSVDEVRNKCYDYIIQRVDGSVAQR